MESGYWIAGAATTLITLLTVIEKSQKIKWKPISYFLGKKETDEKIDKLIESIKTLSDKVDESNEEQTQHYIEQAKMFVSNFAADIRFCDGDIDKILKVKTTRQFCAISNLCTEYLSKGWNSEVRHDAATISEIWDKLKNKM